MNEPTTKAGRQHWDGWADAVDLEWGLDLGDRERMGADIAAIEAEAIAAECARTRDGLRRWNATHSGSCRATILGPDARCTCGLSAALDAKP